MKRLPYYWIATVCLTAIIWLFAYAIQTRDIPFWAGISLGFFTLSFPVWMTIGGLWLAVWKSPYILRFVFLSIVTIISSGMFYILGTAMHFGGPVPKESDKVYIFLSGAQLVVWAGFFLFGAVMIAGGPILVIHRRKLSDDQP